MSDGFAIVPTSEEHFDGIIALCREVYPSTPSWGRDQLASHLRVFPEGQRVAVDADGRVIGMSASLIVTWDDYDHMDAWRDFTDHGYFTNHDPSGRTLYGAEIMVSRRWRRRGVGSALYQARRELAERLGLARIRAGARLSGYHRYASRWSPEEYVERVVKGEIVDPTLSFQLRHGFRVIDVVPGYLANDPQSLGYAALIEWRNPRSTQAAG